jgi:hypothetical protein
MATSSFDKKFVISDPKVAEKFAADLLSDRKSPRVKTGIVIKNASKEDIAKKVRL